MEGRGLGCLHPSSRLLPLLLLLLLPALAAAAPVSVRWLWSGAVTETGAVLVFAADSSLAEDDQVAVALRDGNGTVVSSNVQRADGGVSADQALPWGGIVRVTVAGLRPATEYEFQLELGATATFAEESKTIGRLKTFPERGSASPFSVLAASCADSGSNSGVFDVMRAQEDILFYLQLGDLHYDDIDENDVGLYADAYETVMAQSKQRALYAGLPIVYMWDDHDFGPNNARKDAEGREAARLAYQHYVPHYPLPTSSDTFGAEQNVAVYHSFTVGDVYFIITDGRSEKSTEDETDGSKSVLGLEQKAWFKREIKNAVGGDFSLIVWSNGIPWISRRGSDTWAGFEEERAELANFLADNVPSPSSLLMLSGDAHMVALDDGRNNRYADDEDFGFVVVQAAALDRSPSVKGGPYSHGCFKEKHQFVRLDFTPTVEDGVRRTCVDIRAIRGEEDSGDEFLTFSTCNPSLPEDGIECEAPLLNTWEILALVFLIFIVLLLVAIAVFCILRRRRAARLKMQKDGGSVEMEPQTMGGPSTAFLGEPDHECRQRTVNGDTADSSALRAEFSAQTLSKSESSSWADSS